MFKWKKNYLGKSKSQSDATEPNARSGQEHGMKTHLELSLERDIDRIRSKVKEMALLVEQALQACIKAIAENSHQLTYAVILRDQRVNEKEMEIDRLCLEFLVRQQPVALPLRFAYSTIKINLEIERVGDYAESIARQLLHARELIDDALKRRIMDLGTLATGLFHDAVKAFTEQNCEQANACVKAGAAVDTIRYRLDEEIAKSLMEKKISYALHGSLITIVRRFERVSDQARNICLEVIYLCTGEYKKHPGAEFFRVLFVDSHNACLSQMAEAIAQELKQNKFIFASAGIEPTIIETGLVDFMKKKGIDLSRCAPKAVHQIPNLDHYQVVVLLEKEAYSGFPKQRGKVVFLDWHTDSPCLAKVAQEENDNTYDTAYAFLKTRISELVEALTEKPQV
jgi:phosphate transport system protein